MGFLISGVMADYKESEKIPGDIASILLSIADEINFPGLKTPDNPFGYYDMELHTDVSLKPIDDAIFSIQEKIKNEPH
jgi:hypothetical protein